MRYESLRKKPKHFQGFTGYKVEEYDELVETIRYDWEEARYERLNRPGRKRNIGGGSKLKLPCIHDRLLVYVMYAKLYLPYSLLGYLFNVDESTICRIVHEMTMVLGKKIIIQRRPGKRITTIEELREEFPDIDEVLIDTTEQEVPRPQKKRGRKKHYSGKKKKPTIKTQIVTRPDGLVYHVADSIAGRTHDYQYFHDSKVGKWLERNPDVTARLDLGFLGIHKDYPDAKAILPIKRTRNKPTLTRSEKIFNTKASKRRIRVEHGIARLKQFRILAGVYRNDKTRYSATFKSVVSLSNFRMLIRQDA